MRILIICMLSLALNLGVSAQNYYVMSVKGNVSTDGRQLQKKDKLDDATQLAFGSPEAFVYVIAPGKGYYVLSGKGAAVTRSSEIILSLKDALFPPNEFHSTSTRSGGTIGAYYFASKGDLQSFFQADVLLIGPSEFTVNTRAFPMGDKGHFEMVHTVPGGTITKRLPVEKNRFMIDEMVLNVSTTTSEQVIYSTLYYVDKTTNQRTKMGECNLNMMTREEVIAELKVLHSIVAPVASNVFFTEHAKPYLSNNYGNTDWMAMKEIVDEAFEE